MRHNQQFPRFSFVRLPVDFHRDTEKDHLQYCLGATLYMPATKPITEKIIDCGFPGLASMVMCCEDAICEDQLTEAEHNVVTHLSEVANAIKRGVIGIADIPLTFIRVRNPRQFLELSRKLNPEMASVLSGFVFPKFSSRNSGEYLTLLRGLSENLGIQLYGMPILEGRAIAFTESRKAELSILKSILDPFREYILNIRVGGTDFSSLFGVRRGINISIYDILTVRDCLSDILNFFNRTEGGYVVSAPVWEYFLADKKEDLQKLADQNIHRSILNRSPILNDAVDGLLREVLLDQANGFVGKTVIHPSHVRYVNALQAVTKEEFEDARQIVTASGGVIKSREGNKMNEISPHRNWAQRVLSRAAAFGVIEDERAYLQLMIG